VRDTDAETISAILRDEPSWQDIPRELQPILRKCLMKSPDERYQTAKELATDLRELQDHLDIAPVVISAIEVAGPPASSIRIDATSGDASAAPNRQRKRFLSRWLLAAVLASVVLVALLLWLVRPVSGGSHTSSLPTSRIPRSRRLYRRTGR